jgi:hypothetical protein
MKLDQNVTSNTIKLRNNMYSIMKTLKGEI